MAKKSKPYRSTSRFGILNPYGDIWSPETFDTEAEAMAYVEQFWRDTKGVTDLSRFKPVRVRVTVSAFQ